MERTHCYARVTRVLFPNMSEVLGSWPGHKIWSLVSSRKHLICSIIVFWCFDLSNGWIIELLNVWMINLAMFCFVFLLVLRKVSLLCPIIQNIKQNNNSKNKTIKRSIITQINHWTYIPCMSTTNNEQQNIWFLQTFNHWSFQTLVVKRVQSWNCEIIIIIWIIVFFESFQWLRFWSFELFIYLILLKCGRLLAHGQPVTARPSVAPPRAAVSLLAVSPRLLHSSSRSDWHAGDFVDGACCSADGGSFGF